MTAPRAAGALLLVGLTSLTPGAAGGESATDKYRDLLHRKRTLLREASLLKYETAWAASKIPYIFLDLEKGKMEFRVRGKVLKSYALKGVFLDERGSRPAVPEVIWRALDTPITVVEKQGGHPELVPPDPEAGRHTGLLYSDPNQLSSQTGAREVDTDAGVLGVDAPSEYFIRFEEGVIIHVENPKEYTFREKASQRMADVTGGLQRMMQSLWGGPARSKGPEWKLELYVVLDPDTAKYLHYSLLPGEKLVVVPPPPPPVALVASSGAPSKAAASR